MDKAFWGTMRWGSFRWGVYNTLWDNQILPALKNIPAKTAAGITPCLQGVARQGSTRHRVYIPLFGLLLAGLGAVSTPVVSEEEESEGFPYVFPYVLG